jgi:Tfp pilus assembly protein PilO
MSSQFLFFCRFHVIRLLRAQPVVIGALILSSIFVVLASLSYLQQWQQLNLQAQQLSELRAQSKQLQTTATLATPVTQASFDFPPFHSAKLVDAMTQLAFDSKLPINEVTYGLDDNANQPYLRYRVSLTAISSYPVIRRFVDQIPVTLPHVALESISCGREGIAATLLKCELAFSAIFKKEAHE